VQQWTADLAGWFSAGPSRAGYWHLLTGGEVTASGLARWAEAPSGRVPALAGDHLRPGRPQSGERPGQGTDVGRRRQLGAELRGDDAAADRQDFVVLSLAQACHSGGSDWHARPGPACPENVRNDQHIVASKHNLS
jgi:hypothetical protein